MADLAEIEAALEQYAQAVRDAQATRDSPYTETDVAAIDKELAIEAKERAALLDTIARALESR